MRIRLAPVNTFIKDAIWSYPDPIPENPKIRELADLISVGPPQAGQVPALAERYGLQFGQPHWLPEIISRFGLTAPR